MCCYNVRGAAGALHPGADFDQLLSSFGKAAPDVAAVGAALAADLSVRSKFV